jgi:phenylacetate-CoA ligase
VFAFLTEHQHASRAELENYQWQRLKQLIEYAYTHVPFYRLRFEAIGLQPGDIKDRNDFRRIPTLTRDEVVEHFQDLKSAEFEKHDPIAAVTSGTSRDQMKFYRSLETEIWRKAMVWRHYFNIGYHFREPRAELVCPLPWLKDCRQMPIDYNENALLIDPTSVSPEHCPAIHKRLREFAPKMLFCHPGTAATLADNFRACGLPPLSIPLIHCSGELIYPWFRQAIKDFFGGEIIEYYGNRENSVAATQLADGHLYVQSDYCHLEFLDDNEGPIAGTQGTIVSTSLVNYAFPFIRYHTDDVGILHDYPENASRNFPVMEIVGGRGKDLLLTREGLRSTYLPKYFKEAGFLRYQKVQLVQPTCNELILRLVPTDDFRKDQDEALLKRICRDSLGSEFSVEIQLVDKIAPTGACKNKMVISQPAIDYLRKIQRS